MVQLVWIFLLGSLTLAPFAESQYRPIKKEENSEAEKELQRKAVLKALGSLIMERRRKGKTLEFDPEGQSPEDYDEFRHNRFNRFHDKEDVDDFDDYSDGEAREGKQVNENLEECETQGFETRTREECNEVSEIECNPIQVTKYKTEIVQRCKTVTDQICEVLNTYVPKEKCGPSEEERCYTAYKIVEEEIFKDECHTEEQNHCEKKNAVPVEAPASPPLIPSRPVEVPSDVVQENPVGDPVGALGTPRLNEKTDSGTSHLQDLARWWRTSQRVDIQKISQFYWALFEKTRFLCFYIIKSSKKRAKIEPKYP